MPANLLISVLYIAAGAVCGALGRFFVGQLITSNLGVGFPWATMLINLSGCLLIGLLSTKATNLPAELRLCLFSGFVSSYTTFATFVLETCQLWQRGQGLLAVLYVLASVLLGVGCFLLASRIP